MLGSSVLQCKQALFKTMIYVPMDTLALHELPDKGFNAYIINTAARCNSGTLISPLWIVFHASRLICTIAMPGEIVNNRVLCHFLGWWILLMVMVVRVSRCTS